MPNCIRPPHFPPGCGCPVGVHSVPADRITEQRPLTVEEATRALDAYAATWPSLAEFRSRVLAST